MAEKRSRRAVHKVQRIYEDLTSDRGARSMEGITPLARNEWVCWMSLPKAGDEDPPDRKDAHGLAAENAALLLARLPSSLK